MSWNEDLFRFINQDMANPGLDVLFSVLILLGTVYVWLILVPALWWKGKRNEAVDLFFLILLVLVITTILKFMFAVPRPTDIREVPIPIPGYFGYDVYSFPSNHASRAFACAMFLSIRFRKWTIPLFVYAFLIGLAKIYVGAHYPVDVIGGATIGVAFGMMIGYLERYSFYGERRDRIVSRLELLLRYRGQRAGGKQDLSEETLQVAKEAKIKGTLSCKSCGSTYGLSGHWPRHAGDHEVGFLYCDRDPTVVTWSAFDERYLDVADNISTPWNLSVFSQTPVEAALKPCPCGGRFKFENRLLCPDCRAILAENMENTIYFYIIGEHVDGEEVNIWEENLAG
jgi:undecaprenyl-diphosphatase